MTIQTLRYRGQNETALKEHGRRTEAQKMIFLSQPHYLYNITKKQIKQKLNISKNVDKITVDHR
jgi:hypothetical protein